MTKATPAAIAVLRQATALRPKRKKASDGLLPSAAHMKQSPTSDHNTGLAVDLTHDLENGIDCVDIFENLKKINELSTLSFKERFGLKKKVNWETDGTLGLILIASIYIFLLSPLWVPILLHGFGG